MLLVLVRGRDPSLRGWGVRRRLAGSCKKQTHTHTQQRRWGSTFEGVGPQFKKRLEGKSELESVIEL